MANSAFGAFTIPQGSTTTIEVVGLSFEPTNFYFRYGLMGTGASGLSLATHMGRSGPAFGAGNESSVATTKGASAAHAGAQTVLITDDIIGFIEGTHASGFNVGIGFNAAQFDLKCLYQVSSNE